MESLKIEWNIETTIWVMPKYYEKALRQIKKDNTTCILYLHNEEGPAFTYVDAHGKPQKRYIIEGSEKTFEEFEKISYNIKYQKTLKGILNDDSSG